MTVLIVLAIIVTLAVVAAVALRVFNITVGTELQRADTPEAEDGDAPPESEGDGEPPELVNLFDYFQDESGEAEADTGDGQEAEAGGGTKKKPGAPEEAYAATTDKLTEFISGRRYLIECKKVLEAAKDEGHIYCAMYFDYDRFSYINSLKGAATGDYVLTNTAQQLRRIFPENAQITRISCDHFTAVFPLVDPSLFEDYYEQLRRMCEKIRSDIAVKTNLKICVGFATTDNDSSYDPNVLLTRANVARHCAKVTKVEKFESYDEAMIPSNFFGDTIMDNYSECQYGDEFALYFETILDLVADKVVGCDSLVRWSCEDNSSRPITLETGSIPTNNDKVLYHACKAMSRWRKAAREAVLVFVEVPVTMLFKADIDEFIGKCLTEFQVDPQMLVLKINVCLVRLDWSMCSKQFKRLRELGVKICISGMDTGYSNLEFLSGLPIDYVKLHKSFVHGVDVDPDQLEKCRKISERVIATGARVIFEGVDTVDQVSALRKINVKLVHGRYSGRPTTADELSRTLPEHIERRISDQTVILDESQLSKGEWKLF